MLPGCSAEEMRTAVAAHWSGELYNLCSVCPPWLREREIYTQTDTLLLCFACMDYEEEPVAVSRCGWLATQVNHLLSVDSDAKTGPGAKRIGNSQGESRRQVKTEESLSSDSDHLTTTYY